MSRKLGYLLIIVSALVFSGCAGRTVGVQQVASIENGKNIFDELALSELYVKFHQNKNGVDYDEISTTPFPKNEIDQIYKKNAKTISAGKEEEGLSDCLKIEKSGKIEQCYRKKRNTVFIKKSPLIAKSPISGAISFALLPIGAVLDILEFDTKATQTKKALVTDEFDTESMIKYGKYLVYKISNDLNSSKGDFQSYKKYLADSGLINSSNSAIVDQLRSYNLKEAYDLAYDMSLAERDLKKAYPTYKDINSFLRNPHQADLAMVGEGRCFTVDASKLNIRNKPTTKRSKVVGKYSRGDLVCPVEEKNGWVKSNKGWARKKYLTIQKKSNKNNLSVKITKVKNFKRKYDLQDSLKTNSIASYEKYKKEYGSDKDVDTCLQELYRKEGEGGKNADTFKKSYMISVNDEDVVKFIEFSNLESVRNEYESPSFITSQSHKDLLKTALIERLRKLDTLESMAEVYRYSGDSADLQRLDDTYDDGVQAYENKDYKKALLLFQKVADLGYPWAQYKIGDMYYWGNGVTKDEAVAFKWYSKTARSLQKLAERGDAKAQYELGFMYDIGRGVTEDDADAFRWYSKAAQSYQKLADRGQPEAQYQLGRMYKLGYGVTEDDVEALKWYRKAANQNYIEAQSSLGTHYECEEKYEKSFGWYLKAANQGDEFCQFRIGDYFTEGKGVSKDLKEGLNWYLKAAKSGHYHAQYLVAKVYYRGDGTKQDYAEAIKWFTKSALSGDCDAQYDLGEMYYNGVGVEKDHAKAFHWYEKSADSNLHPNAMFKVIRMLYEGDGVMKEKEEAIKRLEYILDPHHMYVYDKKVYKKALELKYEIGIDEVFN